MKTCGNCGIELGPRGVKFCSRTCSNRANVAAAREKNTRPMEERFWAKVRKSEGCWEWTGTLHPKTRYGAILMPNGKKEPAHRMSYRLAHGEIPKGQKVLHRCDNPPCVNPDHLFLGTQQDNVRDCVQKGRNTSKLSRQQVEAMLKERMQGARICDLAIRYGVKWCQVWKIVNGRQWKHVQAGETRTS